MAGVSSLGGWARRPRPRPDPEVLAKPKRRRFTAEYRLRILEESADAKSETILTASFDLEEIREYLRAWGVFRDRRPDLYHPLLRLDGSQSVREPKL